MNVVKFSIWFRLLLILPTAVLLNFPFPPAVGLTSSALDSEKSLLKSYSALEFLESEFLESEFSEPEHPTQNSELLLTQVITPANDSTGTLVSPEGNQFNIKGGTLSGDGANLFHSFEKFGLDPGQIANFLSNPEIRNILSRVVGGDASIINGLIQVTGGQSNLFLINPAGIIFGPNASLNLPGDFTATTANGVQFGDHWFNAEGLSTYEILVGNPTGFAFTMANPGSVVNLGTLALEPGHNLTLLGGTVINGGQLSAPEGQIIVTAVPGENFVRINQEGQLLSLEIRPITPDSNRPNDWSLPITALPDLLTRGAEGYKMEARVNPDGTVELQVEETTIPVEAGTAVVLGRLDSSGETGGTIGIFGETVGVIAAEMDASGTQGGGTVLVGGEYKGQGDVPNALRTVVDQDSVIRADALGNGEGGRVIVWADEATGFYGQVNARGGNLSGNGGFVEVSGKEYLDFQGNVDVSALAGNPGTLLLDPQNITISDGSSSVGIGEEFSIIRQDDFENEEITINQESLQNQAGEIILEATENITIAEGVSLSFVPGGDITFTADANQDNIGIFQSNSTIDTSGRTLNISGARVILDNQIFTEGGTLTLQASGNGSEITITTEDIVTNGGSVTLTAGSNTSENPSSINLGPINTSDSSGSIPGGDITIEVLGNGGTVSTIDTKTVGGNFEVTVGNSAATNPSSIFLDAINTNGGNITLTALGNESRIATISSATGFGDIRTDQEGGVGGNVTFTVGNETSTTPSSIEIGPVRTDGGNIDLTALGNDSTITTRVSIATFGGELNLSAPDGSVTVFSQVGLTQPVGDITVQAGSITQFNVEVLANSLTTDSAGTTELNANVTTTNNQIYNDSVILSNDVTFDSSSGDGTIEFRSTLNGNSNLQLNSGSGNIVLGTVGDQTPLSSLIINTTGQTNLGGNINIEGSGGLNFTNPPNILLTSDVVIDVSSGTTGIDFSGGTVDGSFNLELIAGGGNITLGVIGENTPLSSLTASSSGQTNLAGNITTNGAGGVNSSDITELNLTADIDINTSLGSTGLDSGVILLNGGTVNGAVDLGLDAGSGEIFLGQVGSNEALNSLNISTLGSVTLDGNLTTNESIDFTNVTGGTQINTNTIITSNNGSILFNNSPISGQGNTLTLDAPNAVSLNNVGNQKEELGGLIVDNAETVNLFGSIFTNGGIQFPTVTTVNLNGDSVRLETDSDSSDVNLANALVLGASQLIINAGTGDINLARVGTEENVLGGLTIESATNIDLAGNIFTDEGIDFSGAEVVNLNASEVRLQTSSDDGNINLAGPLVTGESALIVNAGAGNISLGSVGSLNQPLGRLTIESATDVNLSSNIFTDNGLDFSEAETVNLLGTEIILQTSNDNGNVNFAGVAVEGSGGLTINAGDGQVDLEVVGETIPLSTLTINTTGQTNLGGNITTNGAVNLSGAPNVDLVADIVIDSSSGNGEINLSGGTVNGAFNLELITGEGNVTLGMIGEDTPLSSLTVNSSGQTNLGEDITTSGVGGVNFSDAKEIILTNDININTSLGNGEINLNGGTVDGNFDLSLNSGSGNIILRTLGSNTPLQNLTVNSTETTVLNSTVNAESLVTNPGGITQLNGNVTTSGLTGQTYNDSLTILNSLVLTGDEINFEGAVSGNNLDLTLQPFSSNRGISLGNPENIPNSLNLTNAELNLLQSSSQSGFNTLTIGSADTGQINVAGNIIFNDPVTLRSGLGSIQATGFTLSGVDNATLTLEASQDINAGGILNPDRSVSLTTTNGSITLGNLSADPIRLTTAGGAVTLSPSQNLNLRNPTILTNGGDFSINASGIIQLSDLGQVQTASGNISFDGTEILSTIPLDASNTSGQGGAINLTARTGAVTTDDLNSSSSTGGAITVDAAIAITAGKIDSSGSLGNGGSVSLDPENDIVVEFIDAQGGPNGRGGDVLISTERFFRATGSFADQNDIESSISTVGGQGGGSITIRHGGGPLQDPRARFEVGAGLTENGTAAAITTGEFTIGEPNSFEGSFQLGSISIETDDLIPQSLLGNELGDEAEDQNSQQVRLRTLGDLIPRKEPVESLEIAAELPCVPIDAGVMAIERSYTQEFAEYWGISTDDAVKSSVEVCNALGDIAGVTGIKPAVIYANFMPVDYDLTADQSSLEVKLSASIESPESPQNQGTDELEIILVTAEGQPIRKRISGVTRAKVEREVNQFYGALYRSEQRGNQSYLPSAQQLYQWLIASIEAELQSKDVENLIFIMDERLRSLPLAALHDGQQFLIETYSVSLAPSLTLTETRYSNIKEAKILAMGASEFNEFNKQVSGSNLGSLPAVPLELSTILQNPWEGKLLLNEAFTIENLKAQRNITPFGILHLGTHAAFNSGEPDNSYIQFWNEQLGLDQVRDLGLNQPPVKLLVLSACETTIGDREAELGFAGFAAKAGVESVLASLWPVNDKGTFALMAEFYQRLANAPIKAEALRQAQISMLRGEMQFEGDRLILPNRGEIVVSPELAERYISDLSHPYYWAAFTMIGSPW